MMDVTTERTGSATNSRTCAARASRFLFLSLLMVGVLGGQPAEPSDHDGENRPSILFIMSDDHAAHAKQGIEERIGIATNSDSDLFNAQWVKHPDNPLFSRQDLTAPVQHACPVKIDGKWHLYYAGNQRGVYRTGVAVRE